MLKDFVRWTYRTTFPFWQALGLHVTPNHFYWPVPDTRKIRRTVWSKPSELPAINFGEATQLALLEKFATQYKAEYDQFPRGKTSIPHQYYMLNGQYDSVDAEILYCMVREFQPSKIVEVGSGYSTLLSAQALLKNRERGGHDGSLTAIEPYPSQALTDGFPGLSRLIVSAVQDVPFSEFEALGENDILFIDSSHILAVGSDVEHLFLEVVPRLKKGVIVHVHDIYLPAHYPREMVTRQFVFFNEQQILQAFLIFNDSFEVLWGGNFMHLKHHDLLEKAFASYEHKLSRPGSFWMRKTR
jgi:hypothetical protein